MSERDIGLEILEGIREIKAFKAGKIILKSRELWMVRWVLGSSRRSARDH